ncbi:MAG: hypothetical protein KAG26_08660 [Methylococcales bacterium]|nr:hypothetical protein [Methylococcales bacterium]
MKVITAKQVVKMWNDVSIFAKNQAGTDWQINHDQEFNSAYQVTNECVQNGCTFFID